MKLIFKLYETEVFCSVCEDRLIGVAPYQVKCIRCNPEAFNNNLHELSDRQLEKYYKAINPKLIFMKSNYDFEEKYWTKHKMTIH